MQERTALEAGSHPGAQTSSSGVECGSDALSAHLSPHLALGGFHHRCPPLLMRHGEGSGE